MFGYLFCFLNYHYCFHARLFRKLLINIIRIKFAITGPEQVRRRRGRGAGRSRPRCCRKEGGEKGRERRVRERRRYGLRPLRLSCSRATCTRLTYIFIHTKCTFPKNAQLVKFVSPVVTLDPVADSAGMKRTVNAAGPDTQWRPTCLLHFVYCQ